MKTSTCVVMNTDWHCAKALGTGLVITTITGPTRRWATPRPRKCIGLLNHTAPNRQVGLEVRPPVVVKKNHPRKQEGESGAGHPFSFPNISGSSEKTVNQTVRQRQNVIAYFRCSVV